MQTTPKIRYAKSGGVHIAYQVIGDGPFDLVWVVPVYISHLELIWEHPAIARFLRRLASFSRLILFDRRGAGLSDPVLGERLLTLEERIDDVRAVMDAVSSKQAALAGISEGGPMILLFAATYPERTRAVVLMNTYARVAWAPDYPWGVRFDEVETHLSRLEERWGTGVLHHALFPSEAGSEAGRQWWAHFQRTALSPGTAATLFRMALSTDVRTILPAIRVPTLVLHHVGDRLISVDHGRYLAKHISGARLVELPGDDHFVYLGDADTPLAEIEEFLTGARKGPEAERLLATVLFADIVGSTAKAATLGDRRWRQLLGEYYMLARQELVRHRGREIDTAGDGLFAVFDGPARAVRCGQALVAVVRRFGIEARCGLHTGECEVIGDKLGGIAVHIGARLAAMANPSEVLVSSTVKDLVAGSDITFEDRGMHTLKGVPDEWHLYAVTTA